MKWLVGKSLLCKFDDLSLIILNVYGKRDWEFILKKRIVFWKWFFGINIRFVGFMCFDIFVKRYINILKNIYVFYILLVCKSIFFKNILLLN